MKANVIQPILLASAIALFFVTQSSASAQSCCDSKPIARTAAGAEKRVHGDVAPAPESQAPAAPLATKLAGEKMECCAKDGAEKLGAKPAGKPGMMDCCKAAAATAAATKYDVMADARTLLLNHESITRAVTPLPNGVRTVTTTSDLKLLPILRRHPLEMAKFYATGGADKQIDPLFEELSKSADKISTTFTDVENGVRTVSTSDDPEVVKLILAHAVKISDFVLRGVEAIDEFGLGAGNDAQPQAPESPAPPPQEHVH